MLLSQEHGWLMDGEYVATESAAHTAASKLLLNLHDHTTLN